MAGRNTALGSLAAKLGSVVMFTTENALAPGAATKYRALPSPDQNGLMPSPIRYTTSLSGNGRTYTVVPKALLANDCTEYATHRPSGENVPFGSAFDRTSSNGAIFLLSCSVSVRSENCPVRVLNRSVSPSGDHESGICASPRSAFVRRSARPLPSACCQKTPASPSRSDWKAILFP